MTEPAKNLYAFCTERSTILLQRYGRFGMIIPSSAVGLDDTACLRDALWQRYSTIHCSTYSIRPSKLFEGVDQRLCILIAHGDSGKNRSLFTTRYHHWYAEERTTLFVTLTYVLSSIHSRLNRIAQLGDKHALDVLKHIEEKSSRKYIHTTRDLRMVSWHITTEARAIGFVRWILNSISRARLDPDPFIIFVTYFSLARMKEKPFVQS